MNNRNRHGLEVIGGGKAGKPSRSEKARQLDVILRGQHREHVRLQFEARCAGQERKQREQAQEQINNSQPEGRTS